MTCFIHHYGDQALQLSDKLPLGSRWVRDFARSNVAYVGIVIVTM